MGGKTQGYYNLVAGSLLRVTFGAQKMDIIIAFHDRRCITEF